MKPAFVLISFFTFVSLASLAQERTIKGMVVNTSDKTIPYATIRLKQAGNGVVSDKTGQFSITINQGLNGDTLIISSLGYMSKELPISEIGSAVGVVIQLEDEYYELDTAAVTVKGLENIVRKAIENMDDNFQLSPYTYPAFFRQYHIENDKCVRLIEAAFDVYDPGYIKTTAATQQEKLKLLALRRSTNYEMNHAQHGDHLQDLIFENCAHYRIGTVLNEKALSKFQFYRDKTEDLESDIKTIHYIYNNPNDEKIKKGTLYLKGESFKIVRIEEQTYPNPKYVGTRNGSAGTFNWVFREGKKIVQYQEIEGKMYLDSISYCYEHFLINNTFHTLDFEVKEFFKIWCGKPFVMEEDAPSGKEFKKSHSLYDKRHFYDVKFWSLYPLLVLHPFRDLYNKDLEWKIPLNEQFNKNGIN